MLNIVKHRIHLKGIFLICFFLFCLAESLEVMNFQPEGNLGLGNLIPLCRTQKVFIASTCKELAKWNKKINKVSSD